MTSRFAPNATAVATPHQLSTQLGDEVVILGLEDSIYYGLADVGVRVWQLIQTPRQLGDIVGTLVAEYDVDSETAEADLHRLLSDLEARGLVAITPAEHA